MFIDEGYDCECIQETSNDLFCVICLKLMRNPVQFKCGHGMCFGCFKRLQNRYRSRSREAQCPQCREIIKESQIVSNIMLHRFILSLMVKCSNYRCKWIGEVSHLEEHSEKCQTDNNLLDSIDADLTSNNNVAEAEEMDKNAHVHKILCNKNELLEKMNKLITKLEKVEKNNDIQQSNINRRKKLSASHVIDHRTKINLFIQNKIFFSIFFMIFVILIYICVGKLFFMLHNNESKTAIMSGNMHWNGINQTNMKSHIYIAQENEWKSLYQLFELKLKLNLLELKMEADGIIDEFTLSTNEKKQAQRNLDGVINNDILSIKNNIDKSIETYDEEAFQHGVVKNLNVLQNKFQSLTNELNLTIADRLSQFYTSWVEHEKQLSHKLLLKLQKIQTRTKYIADYNISSNSYAKELYLLQYKYKTYQQKLTEISKTLDQYVLVKKMDIITKNLTEAYSNIFVNYVQNTTGNLKYVPRFQMMLHNLYKRKNMNGIYVWQVNVTQMKISTKTKTLQSQSFKISINNSAELSIYQEKKNFKLVYWQDSGFPKVLHISVFSQIKEEILLLKSQENIQEVYKKGYQKVLLFPFTIREMRKTGFIVDEVLVIRCFVLDSD